MKIILPDADWEEIERLARNRIDEDADTEQIASEALHGCAILARIGGKAMRARKSVVWFSHKMEEELRNNDYKNGWMGLDRLWLLQRLLGEVFEVAEALMKNESSTIIHECADVANFAMMIADNIRVVVEEPYVDPLDGTRLVDAAEERL